MEVNHIIEDLIQHSGKKFMEHIDDEKHDSAETILDFIKDLQEMMMEEVEEDES